MSCLLFVPADNEKKWAKAGSLACGVIADLEDGIPPNQKAHARRVLPEMANHIRRPEQAFYIRINGLDTMLWQEDAEVAVGLRPDGIIVPKVEDIKALQVLDRELTEIENRHGLTTGCTKLQLLLETARGVLNMEAVLAASPRVESAVLGMADLCADLGISWEDGYARDVAIWSAEKLRLAMVSRGLQLKAPWDSVFINYGDKEGLRRDTEIGKSLGYQGKCVIHPDQVEVVNELYRITNEEYEKACAILESFQTAVRNGRGAVGKNGFMIDEPVARGAAHIMERFERQEKRIAR